MFEDISRIGQNAGDFFQAVFSFKPRAALRAVSDSLSSPWPEEISQILILLTFFLWGMKSLSRRDFTVRFGKVDAAMGLFLLAGLTATLPSPAIHSSAVILKQLVSCAILYFVVVHAVDSERLQRRIIKCLLVSTSIVAFLGLYQFVFGFEETAQAVKQYIPSELHDAYLARISRRRVFSIFVYPNSLAGFLLVVLPLTLLYPTIHRDWLKRKNLHRLIAYLLVLPLPCLASFFLTQSKASFLTLFVVVVASVIAARRRLGLRPKVLAAGLLAILILVSAAVTSPLGRKLLVKKGGYTLGERMDYWKAGLRMFPRNPIIGNGFNSFGLLYPQYRLPGANETRSAHNNYLQVLVETGVVGFVFFAAIWIFGLVGASSFAQRSLKSKENLVPADVVVLASLSGISCFLIHSLADFDLYVPGIAMTVWLLLGLTMRNARRTEVRRIQLTKQQATICTLVLAIVSACGVLFTARTLNANSHLAVAESLLEKTDPAATLEDYENAVSELKKGIWWDGGNQNLHMILGRVYFRLRKYDDALREYAIADRLRWFDPMIAHSIARTKLAKMEREGNVEWEGVLAEFRRAIEYSPVNPFHRLVYAYYLARAGFQKESDEQLVKMKDLDPTGKQAMETARLLYRNNPFVGELKGFLEGRDGARVSLGSLGTEK